MLDVRITAYVVPVAEQPQASLTPVISVQNVADEDAVITGLIRIYRDSTGLLIYSSRLAVTHLAHGTSANIAALTPFDPPAPADDDYFIKADITATSYLPGPPITASLGAWHFDIKTPPMGEAPAGHHVTHEDGGSDEIDVAGLSGELADPQPPKSHSSAEHDASVEATANKGAAGGYCALPDPLDPTLPLRADGTPARPAGFFASIEFLKATVFCFDPWYPTPLVSGTMIPVDADPDHPGVLRFSSSASANSGFDIILQLESLRLAGSEGMDLVFRPQTLAGTIIRFGLCDAWDHNDAVDGCYLESIDGLIVGKTANNSARSTTASNYLTVSNTWYRAKVLVNSDATRVDFYLYAADGTTLLWTDFLTTNIPTAAGREIGSALVMTRTGGVADLVDCDYMELSIPRVLTR